ncbi:hypothetical protein LCGC14_1839120 [marine sediment metagenome]|uniref:Uncharacterized protein n=1 Tax=marine sediment metagenome TaxID=412755 RepID=A0A0F9IT60_9ZZZZ
MLVQARLVNDFIGGRLRQDIKLVAFSDRRNIYALTRSLVRGLHLYPDRLGTVTESNEVARAMRAESPKDMVSAKHEVNDHPVLTKSADCSLRQAGVPPQAWHWVLFVVGCSLAARGAKALPSSIRLKRLLAKFALFCIHTSSVQPSTLRGKSAMAGIRS